MPNVGFIWSLKPDKTMYYEIEKMNIPNLLLKKFVPQKPLLNHKKVKSFITHCGMNSVLEANYFGKAIIGMPRDAD